MKLGLRKGFAMKKFCILFTCLVFFVAMFYCCTFTIKITPPTKGKTSVVIIVVKTDENETVYVNLGKNKEGLVQRYLVLPKQQIEIPITIPEGKDEVEVPIEDKQGVVLMTYIVSKTSLWLKEEK